jgi:hypothetical protein
VVRPARDSNEPWSEVPPEIEELLRAQISTKVNRPAPQPETGSRGGESSEATPAAGETKRPSRSRRSAPAAAAETTDGGASAPSAEATAGSEASAPKKRAPARRKPAAAAETAESGSGEGAGE